MSDQESDPSPAPALTASQGHPTPREALTQLRAGIADQPHREGLDRRSWESTAPCLAHTDWSAPSGREALGSQLRTPAPHANSGSVTTLQGRARNILYRWRAFRHRGLTQPWTTPTGLLARIADRSLRALLRLASHGRAFLSPLLSRFGLGRKILQRIPPPPTRLSRRDSQTLLLQRLTDVERQLELLQAQIARYESPQRMRTITPNVQPASPYSPPARSEGSHPLGEQDFQELRVVVGGGGFDFREWEEHTRGDERAIRDKQSAYLDFLRGCPGPVLDAGCGRGEFLELLREAGIAAYGIDLDESMVSHCQAKGLHAEKGELLAHLSQLPEGHLGALFAGQVVEHLPTESLAAFVHLAYRKMASGATIVLETINPECLTVFSGAFYADPTHTKPVHPKAIEFFLKQAGFGPVTIHPVSPIASESKLQLLRETGPVDPAIKNLLLQANFNFERLNDVLYKAADYAAVARKP